MSAKYRRHTRLLTAAALGISATSALLVSGSATGANLGQLKSQLNSTQSELNANQAHQRTLSGSVSALNGEVASLTGQISLVQSREASARARLDRYDTALSEAKAQLRAERAKLALVRRELGRAQKILAAELVSQYEQPKQTLMSVVIDASGFNQMLSQLQYLSRAKQQEQSIIKVTRSARAQAIAATVRIGKLEASDQQAASSASVQTSALSGMNTLLTSRQTALSDARAAQATALAAAQNKGSKLRGALAEIQKQEQAAQRAAQAISVTTSGGTTTGGSSGGSSGWAIPYAIVLCESGGQNLPPNAAGASGYYQIIPSTWTAFGGTGPAAYLASKAEQDAVAAKIWNGGAGASDWTCSSIVGIT